MMFRAAFVMTVTASAEGDQISKNKLTQTEGFALTKLAESASQLLRYGAAGNVLSFTKDTLDEIKQTVLPAITQSHEANIKLLKERHQVFVDVMAIYEMDGHTLNGLRDEEKKHSKQHMDCRARERTNCSSFTECTNDLQVLWGTFQLKKDALDNTHKMINGKMCEDSFPPSRVNRKEFSWEHRTSFETYTREGTQYFEAKDSYEAKRPQCKEMNKTLVNTRKECNDWKQQLEKSSCASLEKHSGALSKLNAKWALAQKELKAVEEDVKGQEKDRKIEFRSIKSIECLLGFINRSGGKPCDKQTGDAQVATCHSVDAHSNWLNIEYLKEPEKPKDLASAPHPCNDDFLKQESYGNLTDYCLKEQPSHWTLPDWTLPDLKSSECSSCKPTTTAATTTVATTTAAPIADGCLSSCNHGGNQTCNLELNANNMWTFEGLKKDYWPCIKTCCEDFDKTKILDGISCEEMKEMVGSDGCDADLSKVFAGKDYFKQKTPLSDICPRTCKTCCTTTAVP